jgi:hypothetical protein
MNAERVSRWQIMAAKYEWGVANRAYRFGLTDKSVLHFVVSPDGEYLDPYILNGQTPVEAGSWHHVAAVFDAGNRTMTLYLDGRPDASRAVSFDHINVSTAPFMLGANLSSGSLTQYFDGQLDDWRVYSRPLSESEIGELAGLLTSSSH